MTTFMLRALFIFSCAIAFTGCSKNDDTKQGPANPAGLGPQGTETEPKSDIGINTTTKQQFQPILDMGQRAVVWLNLVNSHRDLNSRLNLADRTTKNPVPPEKPNVSSVKSILEKFNTRLTEIPESMRPYLVDKKELVETLPIDDVIFLKSIRDLNSTYQAAVRWLGQEAWFIDYEQNDVYDIRGFYFIQKDPTAEQKIKQYFANSDADQATIKGWLVGMCHNSMMPTAICSAQFDEAKTNDDVYAYYQKNFKAAQAAYQDFFKVKPVRKDITWSPEQKTITQNFIDPNVAKVANWLKTNIEEEWKNTGFQLIINFVKQNPISPFIVFEKGVTPHVSGENWETITMDPDYSLDDYNTQWTIRHEFGHILGFPDCYLEFYNKTEKTMTYYTIEPDNLMCAWGGKLQPSHETELRKAYTVVQ
ncbi:MAG: hypothetical protein H7256_04930 [Bdellovibrio sp.]|nr:hypothetical protein [Bdellovibrio sp.]